MDYQSVMGEHDPIEGLCFSSNLRKLFKKNMKKRGKKTIEKTHFLIYSRVEDQISGLNEMAYSYIRYTHDKHANSDI